MIPQGEIFWLSHTPYFTCLEMCAKFESRTYIKNHKNQKKNLFPASNEPSVNISTWSLVPSI